MKPIILGGRCHPAADLLHRVPNKEAAQTVMRSFKNMVKRTFLYAWVKQFRARVTARLWTAYDQEMLEFYSHFLSAGDVCFDVGANVGSRTKIFLELGAKVIAVEPQDQCVRYLKACFGSNPGLIIVQKALGESEGEAEIMISNANTISSLSREWIEAVKKSGRFSEYRWDTRQLVPMTTLDRLIEQHGAPAFIKIDVEGFEYQVLKGLSRPVKALSLEFTPELMVSTFKCINHLESLGDISLNYSLGETMTLASDKWVPAQEMVSRLSGFGDDNHLFGDVYVRFSI